VTLQKENITKRYTTQMNAQGLICLAPDLEIVYRRKIYKLKTRKINNQLVIKILFIDNSIFLNQN